MLKNGFLQAVLLGRGDKLKLNHEELLSGEIWAGSEAVRFGLVDELGGLSQAYEKAAALGKISHYLVKDIREMLGKKEPIQDTIFFQLSEGLITPYPRKQGIYYLFIPEYEGLQ